MTDTLLLDPVPSDPKKVGATLALRCTAPIAHGAFGESAGNATLIRRMAIVSLPGMPRVPVVSGNAIRGVARRLLFRDLFARAEVGRETPNWDRLYAALANGGHLESAEKRVVPDDIRELRSKLPPLSVFGAALYSHFVPGHWSCGIAWPVCAETVTAGLVEGDSDAGAEDLVEEISMVRHIDREHQDPEVSGVTPMPTTIEAISTGTVLMSRLSFAAHATPVERGAVFWALSQITSVGGKSGSGMGQVEIELSGETVIDDIRTYKEWRDSAPLSDILVVLADKLAKPGRKKK